MKAQAVCSLILSLVSSSIVYAADASTSAIVPASGSTTAQGQTSAPAAKSNLLMGFKSYNQTGRDGNLTATGLVYSGKQEAFLGYKGNSGWGGYFQVTQYRYEYTNSTLSKWSASDPSLSLIHPDYYNNGTTKVTGLARTYIPFTDRSKSKNIRQFAYYLTVTSSLGAGRDFFNQTIPRYFLADVYSDKDTKYYIEDRTTYSEKLNSWARWGVGQWTQIEFHSATETGSSVEVYPMFDFMISPTVFFGPRIYLPIYSQNSVYDGPKSTNLDQARAEIYFQANL